MKIITSSNGNTSVLLPTQINQLYCRCDGGAIVNKQFDADLQQAYKTKEFEKHTVAQKADIVLLNPNRPGYQPKRMMSLGEFYTCEPFQEIFLIPVQSWILNDKNDYVQKPAADPNRLTENVVSTFMMRGRSIDEFSRMVQPFEVSLFEEYRTNQSSLQKQYKSIDEFIQVRSSSVYSQYIFTFEFVFTTKGKKSHYYLTWSYRSPENDTERELLEIGALISGSPEICSYYLINPVAEKGHQKALETNPVAMPANGLRPGLAANSLPATATK